MRRMHGGLITVDIEEKSKLCVQLLPISPLYSARTDMGVDEVGGDLYAIHLHCIECHLPGSRDCEAVMGGGAVQGCRVGCLKAFARRSATDPYRHHRARSCGVLCELWF